MPPTLEEHLAGAGLSWAEFCREPYALLREIAPLGAVYCEKKAGLFLFDRARIRDLLLDPASYQKRFSRPDRLSEKVAEFFGQWVFFREDEARRKLKSSLFRALSAAEPRIVSSWTLPSVAENDLFGATRRCLFHSVISIFFDLSADKITKYFGHCEAVFSAFQGDRHDSYENLDEHIDELRALYGEQKRFEFNEDFFSSAVLNAVVDGYEPLSDAIWNTVEVMLANSSLDRRIAYRVAITLTPSFRYVVRHCEDIADAPHADRPYKKVYCFLSEHVLGATSTEEVRFMSYGDGAHVCAGRGLADELVPIAASSIRDRLAAQGIDQIGLSRSDGLGSEGVHSVTFQRCEVEARPSRTGAKRRRSR